MKIILGSTSESKKQIVKEVFDNFKLDCEIIQTEVSSDITDQPLNEVVTVQGSINRAKNASKRNNDFNFTIGLEGGLDIVANKGYFLVCAAALYDRNNVYVGVSSKLQLPQEVSIGIEKGQQFGDLIRKYSEEHDNDIDMNVILNELISRRKSFAEALTNAYLTYISSRHFN